MENDIVGYCGVDPDAGIFVSADDALDFALERCGIAVTNSDVPEKEEFLLMFEEWFFDSWVKEKANDD